LRKLRDELCQPLVHRLAPDHVIRHTQDQVGVGGVRRATCKRCLA
jgi:hypothetical protein